MPKRIYPRSFEDVDLPRLCAAYRAGRRKFDHFRQTRTELIKRIAGDQWSETTATVPRPVNCLSMYCRVVPRNVVPKEPRVDLSTHEKEYRTTVAAEERWVNEQFKKQALGEEFRQTFIDALLVMGVMKVGLASPGEAQERCWGISAGKPFAERVSLDDFCFDPIARDPRRASWYAHKMRLPLKALRETGLYERAVQKRIEAQVFNPYTEDGGEKARTIGPGTDLSDEAFEYAEIVEFYLPHQRLVVTMLADELGNVYAKDEAGGDAPLDVREWVGPDCGPYHFLILQVVPDNALGKGPIQDIVTLDEHFNAVMVKLIEQAGRQKENLIVGPDADKDAERIIDARDGVAIRVDNPDKIKSVAFGGPSPTNQAFGMALWDLINKLGGNIEAMAGLGAQAGTATQEKIINANSSATVSDMQEHTLNLIASVSDALCWYYHYHPELVMETSWSAPSMPTLSVKTPVYPGGQGPPGARKRDFSYDKMCCRVDPYSLSHQTPQGKLGFILQIVTQVLTPLAPLLMQDGVKIDTNSLLEKLSELSGVAELAEVVKYAEPPEPQAEGDSNELPHDRTLPVATERTYNRVNQSEKTESGQRTAMQQLLTSAQRGGMNGQTMRVEG